MGGADAQTVQDQACQRPGHPLAPRRTPAPAGAALPRCFSTPRRPPLSTPSPTAAAAVAKGALLRRTLLPRRQTPSRCRRRRPCQPIAAMADPIPPGSPLSTPTAAAAAPPCPVRGRAGIRARDAVRGTGSVFPADERQHVTARGDGGFEAGGATRAGRARRGEGGTGLASRPDARHAPCDGITVELVRAAMRAVEFAHIVVEE